MPIKNDKMKKKVRISKQLDRIEQIVIKILFAWAFIFGIGLMALAVASFYKLCLISSETQIMLAVAGVGFSLMFNAIHFFIEKNKK
jgi:4-hydroxybenzoate polyprenyltransferase